MSDWTPTLLKLEGGYRRSAWYTSWAPDRRLRDRNAHGVDDHGVEYRHYIKDSNGTQYDRYRYYYKGTQLYFNYEPYYVVVIPMTRQKLIIPEDVFNALIEK